MTKYMRSQHVPLTEETSKEVQQELDDFLSDVQAGNILKILRKKNGWTEAELGEKANLDEEHILLIERGEQTMSVGTAKTFGKLFNVDHHLFL